MSHYGTLAGALAYHAARGNAAWSAAGVDDAKRTAALTRGADYVDGAFRSRFPGTKTGGRPQEREWPRAGATDRAGLGISSTETPIEIENAGYEAALRELVKSGSLRPDQKAGGGVTKRVKAGPVEIEYAGNGADTPAFPAIEAILGSLLAVPSGSVAIAVRA